MTWIPINIDTNEHTATNNQLYLSVNHEGISHCYREPWNHVNNTFSS